MVCPDEAELLDFASGRVGAAARAVLEAHVDVCESCFEAVAELAGPEPGPAPPGRTVGRYRIVRALGSGAMGTVYEAHDPVLERAVALKVLRADQPITEHRRLRLLREAQSLARIQHRHVVAVHDASEVDEQVYLAMELVDGAPLDAHLGARRLSWDAIVQLFLDAGAGLAAAHDAGIVHRDVKPTNVLVARDGRVVVTDFGLAAALEGTRDGNADSPAQPELLAHGLSTTRACVGTPAYMAPEQLEGRRATAHSDQFAFCVALFEALTGSRPFEGASAEQWHASQVEGPRPEALARMPGPASLRRVVSRGLEYAPERRYASMHQLLAALRRARRSRRRRGLAATGLLLGAGALAGLWANARPPEGCDDPLAGAWGTSRRAAAVVALRDSVSGPWTRAAAERRIQRLDEHAEGLQRSFGEVCGGLPRDVADAPAAGRAQWSCLQGQLETFDTLTAALAGTPADRAHELRRAADDLGDPSVCRDPVLALRRAPQPEQPDVAAAVHALRLEAKKVKVKVEGGEPGSAAYQQLLARAVDLGFAPARAEVQAMLGVAFLNEGRFEDAARELKQSYAVAVRSDHEMVAASATRMLLVALRFLGRFDEARAWAEAATPIQRAGWEKVELAIVRGMLEMTADDPRAAKQNMDEALALREACGDCEGAPDHLDSLLAGEHGELLVVLGRPKEGMVRLRRAVELDRERLGPGHISTADALAALASAAVEAGELKDARGWFEEAISIADELGQPHPTARVGLGVLLAMEGDDAGAVELFREARVGADPALIGAVASVREASSLARLGHGQRAQTLCEGARDALAERFGTEHARAAWARERCENLGKEPGDVG